MYLIREATINDLDLLDKLVSRSFKNLLSGDYAPSVLVQAMPVLAQVPAELVASGSYYVAQAGNRIVGCGGWSVAPPYGHTAEPETAYVRHFATDPEYTRTGVGREILRQVIAAASLYGAKRMVGMTSRSAVSFYRNLGFIIIGERTIKLPNGTDFPAVEMWRELYDSDD